MTTQGTMPIRGVPADDPTPEYDALAELFLAPDAPSTPHEVARPTRVTAPAALVIEAVIIGHLPVLGPAWVGQYARNAADEAGAPVAVLHAGSGRVSIDIHGLTHPPAPISDVGEALAAGLGLARRWILRADELEEPALWDLAGLDAVTLLTGADPMATVASYRTLKRCLSRPGSREGGPSVCVAIMGSAPAEAATAEASLRRAVEAFVDAPVEFRRSTAKIGASRPTARIFESSRGQDVPALVGLLRSMDPQARIDAGRREEIAPEPRAVRTAPRAAPEPTRIDATAREFAECATSPLPLASHVPGLEPLPARCPYAPEIELAATRDGHLHLLTRAGTGLPSDPIARLLAAAMWADEHAELLRLAIPALTGRTGERAMHLFLPSPSARPISAPGLHVHVLAPVRVGDRTGWYCAELA